MNLEEFRAFETGYKLMQQWISSDVENIYKQHKNKNILLYYEM